MNKKERMKHLKSLERRYPWESIIHFKHGNQHRYGCVISHSDYLPMIFIKGTTGAEYWINVDRIIECEKSLTKPSLTLQILDVTHYMLQNSQTDR